MARPRVIISTDLGGNDKDDAQSLIHALLYANDMDYRGIVLTRTDDGGRGGIGDGATLARGIIDAYAKDLGNLRAQDADYPGADALRGLIRQGATNPDWPGGVSDGAKLIIDQARAASPADPLYVLTWGPIHDAARALRAAPDIVDNVRIIAVAGIAQDKAHQDAYRWIVDAVKTDPRYKDLWMIDSAETFRGIHVNASGQKDRSLFVPNRLLWYDSPATQYMAQGFLTNGDPGQLLSWVKANADGHGALGDLLHDKYTYDLYGPGTPDGLKMGDTPSLLYLLDRADNDNPGASSWGGSFKKSGIGPNFWVDKTDDALRMGEFDGARTVYEHRDEVLSDFAKRLDAADGRGTAGPAPQPEPEPTPEPTPEPKPPAPVPEAPTPDGSPGGIGIGRTEAEALKLQGYTIDGNAKFSGGQVIKAEGSGSASGVFAGPAGEYRLTVGSINEDDGASSWKLVVNGKVVADWTGTGGDWSVDPHSATVRLAKGDIIAIQGERQGGEHARVDWIEVKGTGGSTPAPTTPPPDTPSSGPGIDLGRTEIESLSLKGYAALDRSSASGGAWVKAEGTGTASGHFDGPDGRYGIDVFYFNENDGASLWRVLVDGETVAAWDGRGGRNAMEAHHVEVDLDHGDLIELVGVRQGGEHARLDQMVVTPVDDLI